MIKIITTICLLLGIYLLRVWLTISIIKYLNHICKKCNARVRLGVSSIEIETNAKEENAASDQD